jgi:HlyD family secretion protein
MKTTTTAAVTLIVLGAAGAGAYRQVTQTRVAPAVFSANVTYGNIVESVKATGTLTPLRSVDIGTQVSGTVKRIYVDFNSIVKRGQLLAELDPALFQMALESAQAMIAQAQVALDEQRQVLEVDQRNLARTQALLKDHIATQQDVDEASVTVKQDAAVLTQDDAAVASARASVEQAQVNLSHCMIYSPTDGVVINREVDEGQAVAAAMSAPSLFILGTDLHDLQLIGDVDESDVGRLRPGQVVSFTVDAYPGARFPGRVTSVRLNSTTTNNVVTYQVVISATNPELRLLPGMTASLSIETARVNGVVRLPNAALRFRPSAAMFKAFGQPLPKGRVAPPPLVTAALSPASVRARQPATTRLQSHATIDEFFQPLAPIQTTAEIWQMRDGKLTGVPIEVGGTDGLWTELRSGAIHSGDEVVTGITVAPGSR